MTLKEAYQYGEATLLEANITEARIDAWLLLEHVTQITRAMYYVSEQKEMSKEEERIYRDAVKKRCEHIPLQHITGVQEFMGLPFSVNEHVLIPRQDTETLVEEALRILKDTKNKEHHILDMCTGSGCILLSILHYANRGKDLQVEGTGVDISEQAVSTAKENANALHIKAGFCQSDLFDEIHESYDMIVSNPPYIRTAEIETLQTEVKLHDPLLALDGKADGLYFYRKIIQEAGDHLKRGGYLLFEIGYDQGSDVSTLMQLAGYSQITVKKDLPGLDRVVIGVYDK